jgi:hypothetical protein
VPIVENNSLLNALNSASVDVDVEYSLSVVVFHDTMHPGSVRITILSITKEMYVREENVGMFLCLRTHLLARSNSLITFRNMFINSCFVVCAQHESLSSKVTNIRGASTLSSTLLLLVSPQDASMVLVYNLKWRLFAVGAFNDFFCT